MTLTKQQAIYCANIFSEYFDKFEKIDDYIRDQKIKHLSDRSPSLPGMGPESELFSDFSMHPQNMNFEIVEMEFKIWDSYLRIISSHANMNAIRGRCFHLGVKETNTNTWVGFIRMGSPVINMKPRNIMLGAPISQSIETLKKFNHTTAMGFVIVPSQPFGYNYLGGKLLAGICCSHYMRNLLNSKYDMETCLFETTSLYGSSKDSSQYDGMKPYLRFKGLTDSKFIPMMHGDAYDNLVDYVQNITGKLADNDDSSRKMKLQTKIIGLIGSSLKGTPEWKSFQRTITHAKELTEQKRYYASTYGFSNSTDFIMGRADKLLKDKENYDKFELERVIEWWKRKSSARYISLQSEGRIRTEQEVWTINRENIDIIR